MTREEFYLNTKTYILGVLSPKYADWEVELHDCRNQGESYKGMILHPAGSTPQPMILPQFNLDQMYDSYGGMESLDSLIYIAEEIEDVMENNVMSELNVKELLEEIMSYERVKRKFYISAVPISGREDMENGLYEMRGDIPLQVRILVKQTGAFDGISNASIKVTKEILERWEVPFVQVFEDALNNMEQLMPTKVTHIRDSMKELMGEEMFLEMMGNQEAPEMYVVSNTGKNNGAANLFLPGVMEKIAGQLGDSYFVLPSSVHESLLIPLHDIDGGKAGMEDVQELQETVRHVNKTQVPKEEQLSYNVYFYDREAGKFSYAKEAVSLNPDHKLVSEKYAKEEVDKEQGIPRSAI